MGMFDSVTFACLECDKAIEVQSKAAASPSLRQISQHRVPLEIAADIGGQYVTCSGCNKTWRVQMRMEPKEPR